MEFGQQFSLDAYRHGSYSFAGSTVTCLPISLLDTYIQSSQRLDSLTICVQGLMSSSIGIRSGKLRGAQREDLSVQTQNHPACPDNSSPALHHTATKLYELHHVISTLTVLQSALLDLSQRKQILLFLPPYRVPHNGTGI